MDPVFVWKTVHVEDFSSCEKVKYKINMTNKGGMVVH